MQVLQFLLSGHKELGRAATVNLDLALARPLKSGKRYVSVQQAGLAGFGSSLAHMRAVRYLTFWCFGAFFRLNSSVPVLPEYKTMVVQLFNSTQRVLVDQAHDSADTLANSKL